MSVLRDATMRLGPCQTKTAPAPAIMHSSVLPQVSLCCPCEEQCERTRGAPRSGLLTAPGARQQTDTPAKSLKSMPPPLLLPRAARSALGAQKCTWVRQPSHGTGIETVDQNRQLTICLFIVHFRWLYCIVTAACSYIRNF